jgi:putative DNA primase/helicase
MQEAEGCVVNESDHDFDIDIRSPEFSDDSLALRFTLSNIEHIRYVAKWGRWYIWDGKRWLQDEKCEAFDLVRDVCREASSRCNNQPRVATNLASAKTVGAVHRLAQSDQRTAAVVAQWDADPWLLNTPGGVIDLRSGLCRAARPEDYLTKLTATAPAASGCARFLKFLDEITAGDKELQAFLQRSLGYALTGVTSAHALFFWYGTGANGKSTLVSIITFIMGDYHRVAPIETFTEKRNETHPTELAGLVGARLVTATETEEGRNWAEARIKQLTGGDPISARFMRQDFFDFTPQFKLFVSGNHKPGLRTIDEAIKRRFHLVPFTVTIPQEQRDPDLSERLKAEAPGILQWLIEGCVQWRATGLAAPAAVSAATADYLESQNTLSAWLEECCDLGGFEEGSSALYASWKKWAEAAGELAGSQKKFSERLETRFPKTRGMAGVRFIGVRVRAAAWAA